MMRVECQGKDDEIVVRKGGGKDGMGSGVAEVVRIKSI